MRRLTYTCILLAIFVLGLALRLHGLDADSLWIDEIYAVTVSRLDLLSIPAFVVTADSHPPLLYVTTKLFAGLVGSSEFTLRLPAALLGSVSILLAGKVGEFLWGRREGLIGAFLLCVSAYHLQYSQEARHYVLMAFLALLSLASLLAALQNNRKRLWLAFGLATTLNLYLHYFAFFILPAELLLAGWVILADWRATRRDGSPTIADDAPSLQGSPRRLNDSQPEGFSEPTASAPRPRPKPTSLLCHLLASLALVGVLYLPWLPSMRQQLLGPIIEVQGLATGTVYQTTLSGEWIHQLLSTYASVDGFPLLLFVALFALGLVSSSVQQSSFIGAWICVPFLVALLVQAGHPFSPKYAMYVVPIYLLTIAKGATYLGELPQRVSPHSRQHRIAFPWAILLLVALLGAFSVPPLEEYYRFSREDWRAATAYLSQNMGAQDIIIADGQGFGGGGDSGRTLTGLSYYFSLSSREPTILQPQRGLAAKVQQLADTGAGLWAVLWHVDDLGSSSQLGEEFKIVEFHNVAVVSLSQPGGNTLEDTVSLLHALLLIQPTTVGRFDLHLALAELYDQMGQRQEAASQALLAEQTADHYLTEVELDPTLKSRSWDWTPYWNLGKTFQQLGMHEKAALAFEQVVRFNPGNAQAYMELGTAYRKSAEPAKALAAYQQALAIEPENAQLHFLLGEAYRGLGRIAEATLAYQEALRIDPTHVWSQRTLHLLSPPPEEDIPHPLLRSLGQQIALLGYDLRQPIIEPGATLDLTLWWQALAKMDRDYTTFVHLKGADNRVCAQEDSLLTYDGQPTSAWRLGMVAKGDVQLRLPPDLPPGEYTIIVGVYYWETGERLPVWDEQAQRQPDDVIALGVITVAPSDI